MTNPTERFTGLAEIYAKARPSYPPEAIDHIIRTAKLTTESLTVDVGCGTGISSRLLADKGFHVIGIEPNADMRKQAETQGTAGGGKLEYRDGSAEETGLNDASVDLVLAAQAFHWFRVEPALKEFKRILKSNGWVALMWNERDESDPFTRAYGDALRMNPETEKVEMQRGVAGEPLLTTPFFVDASKTLLGNSQIVDEEGLRKRAFSASYAPKDAEGIDQLDDALRAIFAQYSNEGFVELKYETSVYLAKKP